MRFHMILNMSHRSISGNSYQIEMKIPFHPYHFQMERSTMEI